MLQHKNNTRIIVRIKDRVYINDAGACIYLHIAQSIFTMEVGRSRLKMEKSILMCMSGCIKIFIVLLFGTIPSGELSETLEILAFEATIWDFPP